jgi:hypothetical protein
MAPRTMAAEWRKHGKGTPCRPLLPLADADRATEAARASGTLWRGDERLGPMADQVKDKAKETGQEALDRGKEVVQQSAQSAVETAQEAGREHAEGLRESAQEKAAETRQQASSAT